MAAVPHRETHREPFIHLAELGADRALVGWGAFWFQRPSSDGRWEVVDDDQLPAVAGRSTCIGSGAEPFGAAVVRVYDAEDRQVAEERTHDRAWVWVDGLTPDTVYRYDVTVDGEHWAAGERHDWVASDRGGWDLAPSGRSYDLRFRTFPDPARPTPPTKFVALGDYGVGTRSDSESSRRQRRIADVLDVLVDRHDVRLVVSLGDNVYQGEFGGLEQESGGEDDDWYSSFYAPYRYALARVPFFPTVGNHDDAESETSDDREQMEDNFHLDARFARDSGDASLDPGLFYRVRYGRDLELVSVDTSTDPGSDGDRRVFALPKHRRWLEAAFSAADVRWRIPFSHHPAYTAGPDNKNDEAIATELLPLYRRGGVRVMIAGHEHNLQIAEADGITHVVSGAAGQIDEHAPKEFEAAHTVAWGEQAHLLLVELDHRRLAITPVSGLLPDGRPHRMTMLTPKDEVVYPPFVVDAG